MQHKNLHIEKLPVAADAASPCIRDSKGFLTKLGSTLCVKMKPQTPYLFSWGIIRTKGKANAVFALIVTVMRAIGDASRDNDHIH